jgi:hypothetical protein
MAEKTTSFTGPIVVGLNDKKGEIRLTDGKDVNEAKYLSIKAPDVITSDTTLTFPNGAGTAGQILSTDGNGGLSWVNDSAGNPAGTNGQVQTNDGGTFGAISEGFRRNIRTGFNFKRCRFCTYISSCSRDRYFRGRMGITGKLSVFAVGWTKQSYKLFTKFSY